jgi:ferredoxin-thioredoxin reductase catalytic subunit
MREWVCCDVDDYDDNDGDNNKWNCPCARHENIRGAKGKLHSFFTSALDGDKWPALLTDRLYSLNWRRYEL